MPFVIELEADNVLKQLDELHTNIVGLDTKLADTFIAWQREDMNRKFPKIDGRGYMLVSTNIYPRSRLKRRRTGKSSGKETRRRGRVAAGRPGSTRPILREELFDQLRQRMTDMLKEAAQWQ